MSVEEKREFILAEHEIRGEYTGFTVAEKEDTAAFRVSVPAVREERKYFFGEFPDGSGFYPTCDFPSDDEGMIRKKGEKIRLEIRKYQIHAETTPEYLKKCNELREIMEQGEGFCSIPFSVAYDAVKEGYKNYHFCEEGYYRVGTENENPPSYWQAGWVGGGMNTCSFIIEDRGPAREQSLSTLKFIVEHLQQESGWYVPMYAKGKRYGDNFQDDGSNISLTRKNADMVYFLLKQAMELKEQNEMIPGLEDSIRLQADAFVRFFRKNGQLGQFVDTDTDELLQGGTACAAISPAALALAWEYFGDESYLQTAEALADIYDKEYLAKGAFIDIKDMLDEVPTLKETIPAYMWEAATVNGGIYAVPNQQIVARQIGALMPKEFVEGTGTDINSIKTLTDMGEYAQKAFDEYGAKVGGVNRTQAADYCGYEYISDYMAAGAIKMDDAEAKVVSFYATDEWKAMLNELVDLNEKGLLDGECGYMDEYCESQRVAKKTSAYYSGTYKPGVEAEESARAGYDCVMATAATDPYISTGSVIATMYGISSTSKHPEETLKYLELVNTDPYVMNLVSYGIEGTHYNKTGDTSIELIPNSGYSHGQSWAVGNVFNSYSLAGQPEDVREQTKALNDSAKASPILGFSFDPEPVKMEITNVSKVVKEYESLVGGELSVYRPSGQ